MSHFDAEQFLIKRFLSLGFLEKEAIGDKWTFIRQAYMEYLPSLMEQGKRDPTRRVNPYVLDWDVHLNEVEKLAWHSIRNRSVVLYPQFPIFNYFIDFANPYLRIGLEVDGKQHDREQDTNRDNLLAEIGWKIFRVTGQEVNSDLNNIPEQPGFDLFDPEQRDDVRRWLLHSSDGVIQSMEWIYFAKETGPESGRDEGKELMDLSEASLVKHQLANFPVRGSNFAKR